MRAWRWWKTHASGWRDLTSLSGMINNGGKEILSLPRLQFYRRIHGWYFSCLHRAAKEVNSCRVGLWRHQRAGAWHYAGCSFYTRREIHKSMTKIIEAMMVIRGMQLLWNRKLRLGRSGWMMPAETVTARPWGACASCLAWVNIDQVFLMQ